MGLKPRSARGTARDSSRAVPDLRSSRAKKFRAIKRAAATKERERKLRIKLGDTGVKRLAELRQFAAAARDAIKSDPDLDDLKVGVYHHVNADGTFDIELRVNDLPNYQDPSAALAIISGLMPQTYGDGDTFISHGARFRVEEAEEVLDPVTGEPVVESIQDIESRYKRHRGNHQSQTYWRDASATTATGEKRAKSVGSQLGARSMLDAFSDRGRKVDTVFVRFHWSPDKKRPGR